MAAGLASCSGAIDPASERLCRRALPALQGPGRLGVSRVSRGPEGAVRIDYRFAPPEGEPEARFASCRFGADATDLIGLTTERGPVTGASLYLLRRYYLDSPEGIAGTPPAEPAAVDPPRP